MKKFFIFITIIFMLSSKAFAFDVDKTISDAAAKLLCDEAACVGSEYSIIGAVKSGDKNAARFAEKYISSLEEHLKEKNGVLSARKYTEYSKTILALSALGEDASSFCGFDIISPLKDFKTTTGQGINGAAWALIALNCADFVDLADVKAMYLDKILTSQNADGGMPLSPGGDSDVDITAMVLCAIAESGQTEAIERAVEFLSARQNENGGFYAWGEETSESASQVLIALSTLGISPEDERFVKNGKSVLDNLMSFCDGNGGFFHSKKDEKTNRMATEQAFCALVAYKSRLNGGELLYDMSSPGFADVPAGKLKNKITELNKKGIIGGKSKYSFEPDSNMTRAEFACIAVKALGLEAGKTKYFEDVDENMWYYGYIAAAYENEIVSGVSANEFNPNGSITCEEAAVMVCRAAEKIGKYEKPSIAESFEGASDWAASSLAFCTESGILTGEILPKTAISRGRVADMIYNLIIEE